MKEINRSRGEALCRPLMEQREEAVKEIVKNSEVLSEFLKKMIIDTLRINYVTIDGIDNDAPLFGEGLGLDSIDALELVVAIEKNFSVVIEDEDIGRRAFASINALSRFIQEKLGHGE